MTMQIKDKLREISREFRWKSYPISDFISLLNKAADELDEKDRLQAENEKLRGLAATCYAGLGAECNLPQNWLDTLLNAADGKDFSTDGLLPFFHDQTPNAEAIFVTDTGHAWLAKNAPELASSENASMYVPVEQLKEANRRIEMLIRAIGKAAAKAKIYNEQVPLTGPLALMLAENLCDCANHTESAHPEPSLHQECWACSDTGKVTTSSNGSGLIEESCKACENRDAKE